LITDKAFSSRKTIIVGLSGGVSYLPGISEVGISIQSFDTSVIIPTIASDGKCSAELTATISPSNDYIIGDPGSVTIRINPASGTPPLCIRSKVFLEVPLQ